MKLVKMLNFLKKLFWGRWIEKKSCKLYICHLAELHKKAPRAQIVDCDKIYHAILKDLGYQGTFGDILKREPREIRNLQEVWELHKLRNTLVHDLKEPDVDLEKAAENYKRVIQAFLKRVSK